MRPDPVGDRILVAIMVGSIFALGVGIVLLNYSRALDKEEKEVSKDA